MTAAGSLSSGSTPLKPTEFAGRVAELAQLAQCVAQVRAGQPWLVVVEGEAGIGKSALVRHLITDLDGFSLWRAGGDPAETDLAYEVIDQLLVRVGPQLRMKVP